MGLFKNMAKNKKKHQVAVAAKKMKKVFKKKAKQDAVMDQEQIAEVVGAMEVDQSTTATTPKKVPFVREGKIKRTQLPLVPPSHIKKGSQKTNTKAEKKGGVLFQRPLTKKKARKLLRDQTREERNREREANQMQQ
ncbi:unnamed protein product, partial [Mesorhabditis belari]|uniref:Uncharacterized protein n=1 Tax=Mesorhabditis belari TaxID=2138241 RepID=A0AAF3EEU5_9BILA